MSGKKKSVSTKQRSESRKGWVSGKKISVSRKERSVSRKGGVPV